MGSQDTVQDLELHSDRSETEDMASLASRQAINGSSEHMDENSASIPKSLADAVDPNTVNAPAKEKKKKSKSQRGVNKPTGFEDYFADAPLTPTQVLEEGELYSSDQPFNARILTAIQRYGARRKLDSERRDVFYKWLVYGGIRVGPNMFQGSSVRDREVLDKDQIVSSLAQTSLNADKDDLNSPDAKYVVDFEGVMRGFLSRRVPHLYGLSSTAHIAKLTSTLLNFLNYLLHHNVCPEYAQSIHDARHVVKLAATDLPLLHPAQSWLPGDFNTACAVFFGLAPAKPEEAWGKDDDVDPQGGLEPSINGKSMTILTASQIIRVGIAAVGSDALFDRWTAAFDTQSSSSVASAASPSAARSVTTRLLGLEILTLNPPSASVRTFYREHTPNFRALGTLVARPWFDHPACNPLQDLTPEEEADEAKEQERRVKEERWEMFVEEQVGQRLRPGMKVLGRVAWWGGKNDDTTTGTGVGNAKRDAAGLAFWPDVIGVWPSWEGGASVNDLVVEGWEGGWRDEWTRGSAGEVDGYEDLDLGETGAGEEEGDGNEE